MVSGAKAVSLSPQIALMDGVVTVVAMPSIESHGVITEDSISSG